MLPRRTRHFVTQVPCPPTIAPVRPSLSVAPDKHHSFALIGNQEYDPVILERSADLIARALVYQALERGQRHQDHVSERRLGWLSASHLHTIDQAPPVAHGYAQAGGPELRPLARVKGLSQEEVEARSGFSQQYLSSLERGRRNPTVITLYELAQALRVSHVELVEPDDDKT